MALDDLRAALRDLNLAAVSRACGVSHNTLIGIRTGRIKRPIRRTMARIEAYLNGR